MTPRFLDPLKLEKSGARGWVLLADLRYESAILRARLIVPAGYETDLASVARLPFMYWLAGNTAHEAAVVHDYAYQTHITDRVTADAVFYEAMGAIGEPAWRRWLMWAAVRVAGGAAYGSGPERLAAFKNSARCDACQVEPMEEAP